MKIAGTPLADLENIDSFDFIRTIAVARILMPKSYVRLSAGREEMNDEMQALCFMAGANSLFYGDQLLTTGNATVNHDRELFRRLGINSSTSEVPSESTGSCQSNQDEGSCGCQHG